MKMIQPIVLDDAQLTASSLTEADYDLWDSGTTYAAEARVILTSTHKVYESVAGSNLAHDPATDDGSWWIEIGATNRWKAFDGKISDPATSVAAAITYTIVPTGTVTGIAFLGLAASQVRVRILDEPGGEEVFDETRSLVDPTEVYDWLSLFTWDPATTYDTEALFVQVPGYAGSEIQITVGTGSGDTSIGQIVLGRVVTLGTTLVDTSIGTDDYSTKDRDQFGNPIIVDRGFSDFVDFRVAIPVGAERRVKRELDRYRVQPALYFADESIFNRGATVYGFATFSRLPLASAGVSIVNIEVEGLT